MGRLVDGEWHTDAELVEHDDEGEFEREETTFRGYVGESPPESVGGSAVERDGSEPQFPVESGRYHLYVSYACPWAHRALVTRALLGLEDAVSVDVVDPVRIDDGWEFSPGKDGCTPDSIGGHDYLREVYTDADPEYTGRVTVPVLWDREEETIVNNESEDVVRMFATEFGDLADRDVDLYPDDLRGEVDDVIADIYPRINNGVYRAGFAESQDAYEDAVGDLFDALERYEGRLADQRYLAGDRLTLADVCMYTTLYRFDEVYHTHFKCNHRTVTDYPNLWGYLKELYQLPGVSDVSRMDHCKQHYYRSHEDLNPKQRVPVGPGRDFGAPHDRDQLPGGPPASLRE